MSDTGDRLPKDPLWETQRLPDNPWAEQLLKAERENHCGDPACQTRRTSAAVRVLTGWKQHQDYCWAVEVFEVEIGVRSPELVGPEPANLSRGGLPGGSDD